jgi:hypothetical protein
VPAIVLPPAIPFTLHVMPVAGLPEPETVAVKTCPPAVGTVAARGEIVTAISSSSVTVAEPVAAASAELTAVTVTLDGIGRIVGAE